MRCWIPHTPVLTEEADLFIDHGGQMNFLLEGDNLAALKLLEKTHRGKIDLIYIDPPYNRGINDFMYDFLDKLIGFKLSDLFYAIFHQYYLAYQDNRAERLAKYIKYGTEDSTEIWMLRYGFSFEEIEWLKPCVESIDQTEIRFNGEIESLDDFQRSSIAQYLF
jgi:DNA modification methylase